VTAERYLASGGDEANGRRIAKHLGEHGDRLFRLHVASFMQLGRRATGKMRDDRGSVTASSFMDEHPAESAMHRAHGILLSPKSKTL